MYSFLFVFDAQCYSVSASILLHVCSSSCGEQSSTRCEDNNFPLLVWGQSCSSHSFLDKNYAETRLGVVHCFSSVTLTFKAPGVLSWQSAELVEARQQSGASQLLPLTISPLTLTLALFLPPTSIHKYKGCCYSNETCQNVLCLTFIHFQMIHITYVLSWVCLLVNTAYLKKVQEELASGCSLGGSSLDLSSQMSKITEITVQE